MKQHPFIRTSFVLASTGLAVAACSSSPPPPNAALSEARAAYSTAANDPNVRQSAPWALNDAQDYLQQAEAAWSKGEDKSEVDSAAYVSHRYSQTAQQMGQLRVAAAAVTGASRTITLGDMLFATGKADLTPEGMRAIGEVATFLKNYPQRTATLMGYTDSTGSAELNAKLSEARAQSVKEAIVQQGIDPSRVLTQGFGPSNPVASNDTAEGRQKNRRVEVTFSGSNEVNAQGSSTPPR